MKRTAICLMIVIAAAGVAPAGQNEDRLYQAILKATFTDEKTRKAEELARLGTPDARERLIALLGDASSWNREGAANGLALFYDATAASALFERMMSDHMIDDAIKRAFIRHAAGHFDFLAGKYPSVTENDKRIKILEIMGASKMQRGEAFLKGVVGNDASPDREAAFRLITVNFGQKNYEYIKGFRDTEPFRVHSLSYLADSGAPSDLAIFRQILDRKEDAKYQLIAYKAVNRWGDDGLKHATFMAALTGPDESLAQGALLIIRGVRSDAARGALCRLTKRGLSQSTRLSAAERLLEYSSHDIVPSLIICLDEDFIHKERSGADIFAAYLTLGISSILDHSAQKQRKKSFERSKQDIAAHLKKITGADNGTSFRNWSDWAVQNGHTVDGVNIIQHLFSGYPGTRTRAVESAIRLLGHASAREFYAKHGNYASDSDLALALAKMLIEKGYLKNEEY